MATLSNYTPRMVINLIYIVFLLSKETNCIQQQMYKLQIKNHMTTKIWILWKRSHVCIVYYLRDWIKYQVIQIKSKSNKHFSFKLSFMENICSSWYFIEKLFSHFPVTAFSMLGYPFLLTTFLFLSFGAQKKIWFLV